MRSCPRGGTLPIQNPHNSRLGDGDAQRELDLDRAIESGDDNYLRNGFQALWGIGRWTVEMFLMFDLHRLDIWPVGTWRWRRGWQVLHGADGTSPRGTLRCWGPFRPYRSVAAWYCWWAVDGDNPSW